MSTHDHGGHGAFHGRVEDRRLVTGRGRYTSDWNEPGQAYAAFLRADRAHATIRSIDTTAAKALPGVLAVYTMADLAGEKIGNFALTGAFNGRNGTTLVRAARTILASDRVRFVGEPIAVVVATTHAAAQDAVEAIAVEYVDLPVVVQPEDAIAPGAPLLHDNIPGNVCFEGETGDEAAVATAFAAAHHVARLTVRSDRVIGAPMEPRACLARYDAARGAYHVHLPTQGVIPMRRQLAELVGVTEQQILVETEDVGGSFGLRSNAYQEYPVLMFAAKRLARPVKWRGSRSESFLTDTQGRAITIQGALALDRDGRFLAARYDVLVDLGAYQSTTGAFGANNNTAHCAAGVYATPAVYTRNKLVMTNTVPMGAYRGAARPDIAYAIERLVDRAADEMGIARDELRRRNFIPRSAFPYKTPNAATYDSGDYAKALAMALEAADWVGFPARREAAKRAGRLRGLGLATFIEGTGGGTMPKDQARLEFRADGTIELFTVSQTQGQSHETAYPLIVARVLGIDPGRIKLRASVPDTQLIGNHTGGSRGTIGAGSAAFTAARHVLDLARRYAVEELGTDMRSLEYADGTFTANGRSLAFVDLVARLGEGLPAGEPHPLDLTGEGVFKFTYPNGAHIAEVDVDPDTGVVTIERYTAVDDVGNVIDHTLVEGQLVGGMAQGAGQVFGEMALYDAETGQLLSGSYMDYPMPRAGWLRNLTVLDNGVPSPTNPLGIKGVGESGTTGSLPVLVNAVLDALAPVGVKTIDMPLTPARVWSAIRGAQAT